MRSAYTTTMTKDDELYAQWHAIANQVLKLPPARLTRSEIDAVSIGLGKRYPKTSERLKALREKLRPCKVGR